MELKLLHDFLYCRDNWKDFIIPSLAIGITITITLLVTRYDRRVNAENRRDDLQKYEAEKLELLKNKEEKTWISLEENLTQTVLTARSHLPEIDELVENSSFKFLKTLSVSIFVNDHLQGLLKLDYREINDKWGGEIYILYVQFLNSIKLIDRLYEEIAEWQSRYRVEHKQNYQEFDEALNALLYEIDKLKYDDEFCKEVYHNLEEFKLDYDKYAENFSDQDSDCPPKKLKELKNKIINIEFMKLKGEYAYLHLIVLNLENSILKFERLSENSKFNLLAIKAAMKTHLEVLEKFGNTFFKNKTNLENTK